MKNSFVTSYIPKLTTKLNQCFVAGVIFISVFASCEKVLEEHPKSLAVETFYQTAAEIEAATNAIYTPYRDINSLSLYIAQLEAYTDYALGRGSYAVLNDFQGLDANNVSRVASVWGFFYESIRNANLVIKNAPNSVSVNTADKNKYIAEAKFLRAFNYFHLVRNWAGVPIRTEANMTELTLKRSTAAEVYDLIIADLKEAETNLPDVAAISGRPTKWSAKTILADVYLHQAKYAEARDKCAEVMNSTKYSLVPVTTVDDFQKIFGPDVVTTPEEIFYVKCTRQNNYGNYWVMFPNHPGTKFHAAGGFFAHHSDTNNPVYKNQDNADLRKGLWYLWNIGLGATSTLNKKFIDPAAPGERGAGNDMPWYRYADVLLMFAEAESRANNGPTPAAIEALNKVHRRAYGQAPNTPSSVDFLLVNYNANSFLDLVIKERGYEFQYEAKRWLDLKRTGKAAEVILAAKGKNIAQKHYLWPIPTTETNFNTAISPVTDQNPGY